MRLRALEERMKEHVEELKGAAYSSKQGRRSSQGKSMPPQGETLGQIQAAPLISSSHGAGFLSYLNPQLSIRTAIPTFQGLPRIERSRTYLTLHMQLAL